MKRERIVEKKHVDNECHSSAYEMKVMYQDLLCTR
jgi:hypothetical protein